MKGACRKCGAPLKKGNITVIRKPGKRTRRECRRCPKPTPVAARQNFPPLPGLEPVAELFTGKPDHGETQSWAGAFDYAGPPSPYEKPQDTADAAVKVEVVYEVTTPTYRYFMTKDQADRVRERMAKTILLPGFGVGFEVIPVPEDQVEADPEAFADLVEVTVDWKAQ